MSPRHHAPGPLAALLALLAMFGPFTIDAFFPAFNAVGRDLRASDWQMQQTISVYLWAYAFMSLFHGPLSDAYGRRRVILWGVIGYMLASIGCALSRSIEMLLAMRVLQGICTGAGLIVGRAMVRDLFHGPDAQRVMSLITVFFSIAPALAPVLGGLVYKAAGWHAVFWFLALYGALLWVLCVRVLPETHPPSARVPFRAGPLFQTYRTILADGRFVLLAIATGFNFGAFFLYIASAPAFVEKLLDLGALGYPWFFVPCIAGMMLGAGLSSRLAGRVAPRPTVKIGYTLMAVAMLLNLGYNFLFQPIAVPWAVLPIALYTFGNSLCFPTLSLKMLDRYPGPPRRGELGARRDLGPDDRRDRGRAVGRRLRLRPYARDHFRADARARLVVLAGLRADHARGRGGADRDAHDRRAERTDLTRIRFEYGAQGPGPRAQANDCLGPVPVPYTAKRSGKKTNCRSCFSPPTTRRSARRSAPSATH
jgi:DHA1 family bicyclomycin/chloramphenicol resistance-like MFS transporter